MPTIMIQHRVRDYDAWRPFFDRHETKRNELGITNARVYRNANDANDLIVLSQAADEAKAREFGNSQDLRNVMEEAGVELATVSAKVIPD